MTPSQYIEASAEQVWKDMGVASSRLCLALVRRKVGISTMEVVRDALLRAAAEAESLVKYMKKLKEG